MHIKYLIKLIRPQQWVKNIFVALPMFFSGSLLNPEYWEESAVAFIAFSLIASSIYCLNDIKDLESDRAHPKKRLRPLASGKVSINAAWCLMVCLIICSFGSCFLLSFSRAVTLATVIGAYWILNIAYCMRLKQYAIIDVFIISFGFVLRLAAGSVACGIWLSPWIVLLTFLLALFLAFAKRRDDVVMRERTGVVTRKNTIRYNLAFLNQTLGIIAAITIVCYIMYTVSPDVEARLGSKHVYVTSVFVLAGILRYLQVALVDDKSGSPTKILLHDRFIQLCIVLWVLSFLIIIYI